MPRTPAKMTIYKLGRELGISPSTVSKALNHSPEISAELRTRVQDLARANQFRPRLVSNRVPNICVLIQQVYGHPLDFSPYVARVMEGVAQYTREEGLEMSIYAADVDELNSVDLVRELRRRGIAGAVVMRANESSDFFKQLDQQHFPYVSLMSNNGRDLGHHIGLDGNQSAQDAVNYLTELGHRCIGVLDHDQGSSASRVRIEGYKQALASAGIAFDPRWVIAAREEQTGLVFGRDGSCELLSRCPGMTALLVLDYSAAIGVLHGMNMSGKKVPEDVSVISFDDYPESAFLNPPLTTIGAPMDDMGYHAARYVYRRMRDLEPTDLSHESALRYQLRVRASTARPKM